MVLTTGVQANPTLGKNLGIKPRARVAESVDSGIGMIILIRVHVVVHVIFSGPGNPPRGRGLVRLFEAELMDEDRGSILLNPQISHGEPVKDAVLMLRLDLEERVVFPWPMSVLTWYSS